MQGFRDSRPHLINITMDDDTQPVYCLGFGIPFSELTNKEKETAFTSMVYLAGKYETEISRLRDELERAKPHRVRVYVRKIAKKRK